MGYRSKKNLPVSETPEYAEWAKIRNAEIDHAQSQGTTSFSLLLRQKAPQVLQTPGSKPAYAPKLDEAPRLNFTFKD